ncbi:MAG: hypothetical protein CMQ39_08720 [Gammaproteobacteria bacterium]|nr:hypothetical protein [Gammaproteobacteria bacterium]
MKNKSKKYFCSSSQCSLQAKTRRFLPQPAEFRQIRAGQARSRLLIFCHPLPRIEGKRQK